MLTPARYAVFEWTDYWLRYDGSTRLRVGDRLAKPIDDGLFCLRFENQLGLTRVQPLDDRGALCPPLFLEVLSPKFPGVERHVAFLHALLEDLFARASRLPFTLSASTARGVSEAPSPPTPLFTLHFLLQHAAELRQAVDVILARPHRRLTDRPAVVSMAEVSEADPDVLLSVLTSPERWVAASGFSLARQLGGYAPMEVWQRRPEEMADTPENRFVLAFLRSLLTAADRLLAQRWWLNVSDDRRARITEARAMLRRMSEHPLFAEVGEMQRVPAASRVLMRREGYRQVLHLWRSFNLARRPFFGALQQAIDLRDVATLYEMWCFFALVEEIQSALGVVPDLRLDISDVHGLGWRSDARFGRAGALIYNKSVKGYSVWLRPDFLWTRNGKAEVALDAKFRLDRPDWADIDGAAPTATAKLDDLYKMHTYRDALGLRAAVVVYPGDAARFYTLDGIVERAVSIDKVIFDNRYGVGAIPLRLTSSGDGST